MTDNVFYHGNIKAVLDILTNSEMTALLDLAWVNTYRSTYMLKKLMERYIHKIEDVYTLEYHMYTNIVIQKPRWNKLFVIYDA